MAEGLELTLIGMGVVLGGLALLALVVRGLEPLAAAAGRRSSSPAASPGGEESAAPAVVAAIAAALAVTLDTEPGRIRLSVQGVRPGGTGPSNWALAGRTEQMRSRQLRGQGGGRAT